MTATPTVSARLTRLCGNRIGWNRWKGMIWTPVVARSPRAALGAFAASWCGYPFYDNFVVIVARTR